MVRAMLRDSRRGINSFTDHRKCYGFCFGGIDEGNAHRLNRHSGRAKERPNYVRIDKERVHPDCINASNPYHICSKICRSLKDASSSDTIASANEKSDPDVPNKLDMKIEEETSRVKDKSLDQTRFHLSDVLSLTSVHSSKISDGSCIDESIPSAGDERSQSKFPAKHPPHNCKEEEEDGPGLSCEERSETVGSVNSNISGITVEFEDRNEEDDRCVVADGYIVDESNSSILHSILDKYGDIAAKCVLESSHLRSFYLDSVCSIVRELHSQAFMVASRSRAEEISAILSDIEASQIDVSWLRHRLDEIIETMTLVSDNRVMKIAKAECDRLLDSAKEDVSYRVKVLKDKQEEVVVAELLLMEAENRFRKAEEESSRLNQSYDAVRFKVEKLSSSNSLFQPKYEVER